MATFLTYLLGTIAVISSILLICVIMIQQSKSGGGLGAVSGGVTESIFGTSAGNVLTKITTWLAVVFLGSTLLLGTVIGRMKGENTSVAEKLLAAEAAETKAAPAIEEAKATAEAVKEEAKATAEAVKEEAKATAEAVKEEAKATAEAVKEVAKPAEAPAK